MFALDIRTIFLCITLVQFVLCLIVLLFWRTQRTYPGFNLWVICNTFLALMYLLFTLRGLISDFWSIVVANTLIAAALSVRVMGLRRFLGMAPWRSKLAPWAPLVSFVALTYFTYGLESILARSTLIALLSIGYLAECARLLLKAATPATQGVFRTFAAIYVLYALAMFGRQMTWLIAPENRDLMASTPVNLLAFLLFIPLDIAVTFTYLIMNSQRMQDELSASELDDRQQRTLSDALRDTATILSGTLDLQQVLNRILENAGRVVPHDAADVMLVDAAAGVTSIVQCIGYEKFGGSNDEAISGLHFRVGDTVNLRHASATAQPFIVADVTGEPAWLPVAATSWIRANLTAPILVDRQVVGFLSLNSATPGYFTEEHAGRLAAFADQAAIAIKNARLYSEARRYAAELEVRNQELDAFAHTVAHDLKNPLWGMVGTAELLDQESRAVTSAEAHQALRDIVRSGHKMSSIIEEILVLAGVNKAGEVRFEALEMEVILAEARARLSYLWEEYGAVLVEPESWPITYGHPAWIEEVWVNYLSNAVKYGGRPPQIEVGAILLDDGMVRCWVKDNGTGIAPEVQGRLFGAFTRLGTVRLEGSGLGLSIVKRIVERHGGQVGVESSGIPGEGSCFSFTLPGERMRRVPAPPQASQRA